MSKRFTMTRLDNKETKGCFRYGFVSGDAGVTSLYIRKENCDGTPPKEIQVTISEIG